MLLPRERVDLSLRLNRPCDHRVIPSGTFIHRARTSAGRSPSGARNCPALRDLGHLSHDDFKFSKRITGLLRGYDHKFLEPHHRHIPPEFDEDLFLNFEDMYAYLKKRFRAQLSKQDLYLILRSQDRFMCRIQAGIVGELTTLDMPYRITHVKACQGHDQSLIDKVGTAPLVKQIISLDYQFTVEDLKRDSTQGFPFIPTWRKLRSQRSSGLFTIILHGTPSSRSFAREFFLGLHHARVMSI